MASMREEIRRAKVRDGVQGGLPWTRYCFDADFSGFDGHFPGQPILPGVFMITAAVVTLEEMHARGVQISEVHKSRFQAPIDPGQEVEVRCVQQRQIDDRYKAQFSIRGLGNRKTSECTFFYTLQS